VDFPESGLDQTMNAFLHHQNGTSNSDQDAFNTTATYSSWHTASIEWSPNQVNFILDNQLVGTSTTRIPDTAMHWVIQTEACFPTCPTATTAGNLQIDWVVAYSFNP
jgi:beta-glucanase (GH16 family)